MDSFRNQIDEIKSKLRFSDELSKHINIVKKGNDIWCLCFFHNEKTPSMKINDDLSSYYCFGCGAKGDILSFYTDYLVILVYRQQWYSVYCSLIFLAQD